MFTAVFHDRYLYLIFSMIVALLLGGGAWLVSRHLRNSRGVWWAGFTASFAGILSVTFMGSGTASGQCAINRDLWEPFGTTQGLWNLAMTVPLGLFAFLAVRRPFPVIVAVTGIPLGIEVVQAKVDGLGRICDSSDAQMNIIGGLVGLAAAAVVVARRDGIQWKMGAKGAFYSSALLAMVGAGVIAPSLMFTHIDGTGLSAATPEQKQAVQKAVKEAFGDRYLLGPVQDQPCVGAPCRSLVFSLISRDEGHPEAFASGTLSWPDQRKLNILLKDSDRPSVMGFPIKGAKPPSNQQDAHQLARSYMESHYSWAQDSSEYKTYPVGEKAELGWITSWRWVHNEILMPRMLDVQVDRTGQISQISVSMGPKSLDLPGVGVSSEQAEELVRNAIRGQIDNTDGLNGIEIDAFTLKASEKDGNWRPMWLVSLSFSRDSLKSVDQESGQLWRVDAINGTVYNDADMPA
ncbi:VanZ family protein [Streptomyces sp. NPDC014861]|uniref:VanZ family protein n=1 Tax=Streptomyces sp. NPDC014861 TaxID=3364923 RepID=UPI0036FF0494